jgi:hypothetical protein
LVARPSGESVLLNSSWIAGALDVFAAAMTGATQGPLAAPAIMKQSAPLVPQKHETCDPSLAQVPAFLARQRSTASHSTWSAALVIAQQPLSPVADSPQ